MGAEGAYPGPVVGRAGPAGRARGRYRHALHDQRHQRHRERQADLHGTELVLGRASLRPLTRVTHLRAACARRAARRASRRGRRAWLASGRARFGQRRAVASPTQPPAMKPSAEPTVDATATDAVDAGLKPRLIMYSTCRKARRRRTPHRAGVGNTIPTLCSASRR